jgi:hypothetical protein
MTTESWIDVAEQCLIGLPSETNALCNRSAPLTRARDLCMVAFLPDFLALPALSSLDFSMRLDAVLPDLLAVLGN